MVESELSVSKWFIRETLMILSMNVEEAKMTYTDFKHLIKK